MTGDVTGSELAEISLQSHMSVMGCNKCHVSVLGCNRVVAQRDDAS